MLIKLRDFCKKQEIQTRYATPYLYEKNSLAEKIENISDNERRTSY